MDIRGNTFDWQRAAQDRGLILISGIVNSALYLIGVFVAGLATGHSRAIIWSLVTAAVIYLGCFVQISLPHWRFPAIGLVGLSILCGLLAGLGLFL